MQATIERHLRSGKHSQLLNRHQCLGIEKASPHVGVPHLAYLATGLTHLKAADHGSMRYMTQYSRGHGVKKPSKQPPERTSRQRTALTAPAIGRLTTAGNERERAASKALSNHLLKSLNAALAWSNQT